MRLDHYRCRWCGVVFAVAVSPGAAVMMGDKITPQYAPPAPAVQHRFCGDDEELQRIGMGELIGHRMAREVNDVGATDQDDVGDGAVGSRGLGLVRSPEHADSGVLSGDEPAGEGDSVDGGSGGGE